MCCWCIPCASNLRWMGQVGWVKCSAFSFELPALSHPSVNSEKDRRLHALWPVRLLRTHIEQMQAVCSSDQRFYVLGQPDSWEATI